MFDRSIDPVDTLSARVELRFLADNGSNALICEVHGELDSATAMTLRGGFPFLAHAPAAVVDLAGVTFIDAFGLGALIGLLRRLQESGTAVGLVVTRPALAGLLRDNGLAACAAISRSRQDAVAGLGRPAAVP
jgi:anti-anti-sigma factor